MAVDSYTEYLRPTVELAANILDDLVPGWHGRVDLAALGIEDCDLCVAGQLGLNHHELRQQCRDVAPRETFNGAFASPEATELWREEILARLVREPTELVRA